jgi:hypothetical protein
VGEAWAKLILDERTPYLQRARDEATKYVCQGRVWDIRVWDIRVWEMRGFKDFKNYLKP